MAGPFRALLYQEVAIDLPSIATVSRGVGTGTITGLVVGEDIVLLAEIPDALNDDLIPIKARVSAADTVEVAVYNPTAGAIDDTSRTYGFLILKGAKVNVGSLTGPAWAG